ncbi:MAG: hypothetical protein NVS4B3_05210 [Gemmatimonadaceae bacterium]
MLFAPRVNDYDPLRNEDRGEWYVRRNDHVARNGVFGDVAVGDIWATIYADGGELRTASWDLESLISHKHSLECESLRDSEADSLDISWCRVCVEPKSHRLCGAGRRTLQSRRRPNSPACLPAVAA